jgi:hypothetical protein
VRRSTADVSVFEPVELCHGGPKYRLVREVLQARSKDIARLFDRVWDSPGPAGCPRLSEWAGAIEALTESEADAPSQHPHATAEGIGVRCPGCGRSPLLGLTAVDHQPDCPLRGSSTFSLVPDKSLFPGVPTHEDIGFVPLFGA